GFRPGTVVSVWLFSNPLLLGHVDVQADGTFDGTLPIPADAELGQHTLQANGLSSSFEERSVSLGVIIEDELAGPPVGFREAPANTEPPQITGSAKIGNILTARPGTWTGTPEPTFGYQWERCDGFGNCVNIPGATDQSYEISADD